MKLAAIPYDETNDDDIHSFSILNIEKQFLNDIFFGDNKFVQTILIP